jgi:glycosyltransferase involved in cell wall biosynthesis
MVSIIIPAHNEETVIGRLLQSLATGAQPGELEVLVVCNACSDRTSQIARGFGEPVRVIESDIASKSNALNLGDRAASGFPRVYADADVILRLEDVRRLAAELQQSGYVAAAPAVNTLFPRGTSWFVRAYYRFWMSLPYVQEGMMAAGVYAVSEEGHRRFAEFPDVIADDGYFRLLFTTEERVEVADAHSCVLAPACAADLIRIKTRSRLGYFQLQQRYPELSRREAKTKDYRGAWLAVVPQPGLWVCAVPYLWVNLLSRWRASRQLQRLGSYVWERDASSRADAARGAG